MSKQHTKIDNLMASKLNEIAKVAKSLSRYFHKSWIVEAVINDKKFARVLNDLRSQHKPWGIDQIIRGYIEYSVGQMLQQRDAHKVRVYECYGAGEPERRWLPLRAMTVDNLRLVIQQTRALTRRLTLKGEGYQQLLEELEKLGPNATVDEAYEPWLARRRTVTEIRDL